MMVDMNQYPTKQVIGGGAVGLGYAQPTHTPDQTAMTEIKNDLSVIIAAQAAALREIEEFVSRMTGEGFPTDPADDTPKPIGALLEIATAIRIVDAQARKIRGAAERLLRIG